MHPLGQGTPAGIGGAGTQTSRVERLRLDSQKPRTPLGRSGQAEGLKLATTGRLQLFIAGSIDLAISLSSLLPVPGSPVF